MDATFWALVALVIFLAIMAYIKVPAMLGSGLDKRAAKIASDLEDARRLREEAQQLLAEYQRKRKEAEKEAASIVDAAKAEAAQLVGEAREKSAEFVTRRNAMAEQKIALAEREAINEVRASAVDIATEAARAILAAKVDAKAGAELFKSSLNDIKAKLN